MVVVNKSAARLQIFMESNTDSPQSSDQEEHVQDTTYTKLRPAPIGHLRLAEVSEFHDMTICNMQVLLPDAAAAAHAAQALGLVPKRDCSLTPPCPKCGESTRPRTDTKNKFGYRFACSNVRIKHIRHNSKRAKTTRVQTCTGSVSPAHNTFFCQIRAPTLQVLQLMYCWVTNFSLKRSGRDNGFEEDWCRFLRLLSWGRRGCGLKHVDQNRRNRLACWSGRDVHASS